MFRNSLFDIDGMLDCLGKLDLSINCVDSLSIWKKNKSGLFLMPSDPRAY